MRIIAGTARSRTIEAPKGRDTRPTLDRVRENLFNILQMRIFDAVCLDLFAGSGALAFEALSRGASHAVLCDHDRNAHLVEKKNAQSLGFDERCEIFLSDWHDAVQRLSGRAFDLIFLDPPYDSGLEDRALAQIRDTSLVGEETLLIVEMNVHADIAHFEEIGYKIIKSKEYKTNKHVFLGKA